MESRCRVCNVELTDENWYLYNRTKKINKICKSCSNNTTKEWNRKNPDKFKEIHKRHHKKSYGEQRLKLRKQFYKKKGFGFEPLNEEFPCSVPHHTHIDNGDVICIPSWLHQAIPHRRTSPESMYAINSWVLFWLIYGDKTEPQMKLPKWLFK